MIIAGKSIAGFALMDTVTVTAFFDEATNTVSYVVSDDQAGRAAIVDSVRDYDLTSGRTSTDSADRIIDFVKTEGFGVDWIFETHVHADHLTAAPYLRDKLGGQIAIGEHVSLVQGTFKNVFNITDLAADGSEFDRLLSDGDTFDVGGMTGRVIATPGHTPACITYVIGDAAFVGDTLFMPDFGTARTDFPGGSAIELYDSIHRILSLPGETRLYMCHDYKAPGRDEYAWETTVRDQLESNIHINESVSRDVFVAMREARDAQLDVPTLILPSIQVNIRAGHLPEADDNGVRYLRIPLDAI